MKDSDMEEINRDAILEDIRREIREKGFSEETPVFSLKKPVYEPMSYSSFVMDECLSWLDDAINNIRRPLRETRNPLKRSLKKVYVRFMVKILSPVYRHLRSEDIRKQECVYFSVSEAINMISIYMREKDKEIMLLKKQIEELQKEKN